MLSGYKLQHLRRLKGLSQQHIADCIDVSVRWISKVECENVSISEETYQKWLLALYGGLKPVKKSKVDSPKLDSEKKEVKPKKGKTK